MGENGSEAPDANTEKQDAKSPVAGVLRSWWKGRKWWILGAAGLVVALTAALIVPAVTGNERERLMRDFLEASRDGRVDEALELAGVPEPSEAASAFLVPEAVDSDWEIVELEETYHQNVSAPFRSTVEVVVRAPNGTRASADVELTGDDDGDWKIDSALPEVTFGHSGLWYLELNGITTTHVAEDEEAGFAVLPGFYRPFATAPEGTEISSDAHFLLPGDMFISSDTAPGLTVDEDGEARVQEEVEDLVDLCLEEADERDLSCPLHLESPLTVRDEEGRAVEAEDVTWEVVEYPVVATIVTEQSVLVSDRVRGVAELTVEGTLVDGGGDTSATQACEIRTQVLEAGFGAEGEVHLRPRGHRFQEWDELDLDYSVNLVDCRH